jgi:hypothetical protein
VGRHPKSAKARSRGQCGTRPDGPLWEFNFAPVMKLGGTVGQVAWTSVREGLEGCKWASRWCG